MPSWDEVVSQFKEVAEGERANWLQHKIVESLLQIAALRGDRNVVLYFSAFLQKPQVPFPWLAVSQEDVNGVMTALNGLEYSKPLTLILHSPGGDIGAPETLMSYLHTKFKDIEVVVPAYAMSAATMMALGSNRIIMGRQSQLGPIDAQMNIGGRQVSAGAVLAQCREAKEEIRVDPATAPYWAPILQTMPPALSMAAQYALDYGQRMVTEWLRTRMCATSDQPTELANSIAAYFNATDEHKHHGRRISREDCRNQGVQVEDLEPNQALQDAVLTVYHQTTLFFETSSATKLWINHHGRFWAKHFINGN